MWDWITKLKELQTLGRPFVVVTITDCKGSTPQAVGAKMIVTADGTFYGTIGGGNLEELALKDARSRLIEVLSGKSQYPLCFKTGQCCGGAVELFMEVINSGPQLYIFGAGHVGQAVCKVLSNTPFTLHLCDERPQWIHAPELPPEVMRHQKSWQEFMDKALWDKNRTYAVVMTHDHAVDLAIIAEAIKRPARYLGLIGSEVKWQRFRQRLAAQDAEVDLVQRVRCPIGLDLGEGKAPQEVAISFAAEILRIHYET